MQWNELRGQVIVKVMQSVNLAFDPHKRGASDRDIVELSELEKLAGTIAESIPSPDNETH